MSVWLSQLPFVTCDCIQLARFNELHKCCHRKKPQHDLWSFRLIPFPSQPAANAFEFIAIRLAGPKNYHFAKNETNAKPPQKLFIFFVCCPCHRHIHSSALALASE